MATVCKNKAMRFSKKSFERRTPTVCGLLACNVAFSIVSGSFYVLRLLLLLGATVSIEARQTERERGNSRFPFWAYEKKPTGYLASLEGGQGVFSPAEQRAYVPPVMGQSPPTFAEFRVRYDEIIAQENAPPPPPPEPEPVVIEDKEPKRRVVVRSEFDIDEEVPGAFPKPERDTLSFEDIYLFFPVNEGDAQKLGLVRGGLNGTHFNPPQPPSLKSGVTFETVER